MERLFQLTPLPSLAPQKTPLWNPSIQEIRHGNLWSMKSKQQSSCPFAPRSRFPPQKSKCHEQLHLVTLLKALMRSTHWDGFSLNFPSKSGLFCQCPSSQPNPEGLLLPLDPGLPCTCQTPSRRPGTTDPGELREQRRLRGAISNSECSGQLPRLCSDF